MTVVCNGVAIGRAVIRGADLSMGVFCCSFLPNEAYGEVRAAFKRVAAASPNTSAERIDNRELEAAELALRSMRLEVRDERGSLVPTGWVHLQDYEEEAGSPEGLLVDIQVAERDAVDRLARG